MVHKPEGLFPAALDLDGEDGSAALGEVFLIQGMVRMVRQTGVVHLFHHGVMGQELHHLFGVLPVAFQPEGQGFRTLEQQEGSEGADTGALIPEKNGPDVGNKGGFGSSLRKADPVVAGVGLGEPGEFAAARPVVSTGIY